MQSNTTNVSTQVQGASPWEISHRNERAAQSLTLRCSAKVCRDVIPLSRYHSRAFTNNGEKGRTRL